MRKDVSFAVISDRGFCLADTYELPSLSSSTTSGLRPGRKAIVEPQLLKVANARRSFLKTGSVQ